MLSVAHGATSEIQRDYPFKGRLEELLPWIAEN